jgi:hypothetical protein
MLVLFSKFGLLSGLVRMNSNLQQIIEPAQNIVTSSPYCKVVQL